MNEIERQILSAIKDGRNVSHVDWATNTDELLAAYQNGSEWHGIIKKYLESLYGNSINKEHVVKHIMLPDIVQYIVIL